MFGSSILEVAIGLIFVFLLLSLLCSAANEIIESRLKNRATDLERGIRELFNQSSGGGIVADFYNHPLINGLFRGTYRRADSSGIKLLDYLKSTNLPTYIPSRNFAYAVIDLMLHPPGGVGGGDVRDDKAAIRTADTSDIAPVLPISMDAIRQAAKKNFGQTQVGRALRTLAEQSGNDVNAMRENVEAWFNSSMDRVSGNYKRRTQWIIFGLGFILTVLLNVNTVTIARRLSSDATLRNVIVAQAEGFANRPGNIDALKPNFKENREELENLGLPMGWTSGIDFIHPLFNPRFNWWDHVLLPLLGWLLTAAAISLGAPFWFDLLNKFMVIRSTVKPHEKSLEEGSEDRQAATNPAFSKQKALVISGTRTVELENVVNGEHEFTAALPQGEFQMTGLFLQLTTILDAWVGRTKFSYSSTDKLESLWLANHPADPLNVYNPDGVQNLIVRLNAAPFIKESPQVQSLTADNFAPIGDIVTFRHLITHIRAEAHPVAVDLTKAVHEWVNDDEADFAAGTTIRSLWATPGSFIPDGVDKLCDCIRDQAAFNDCPVAKNLDSTSFSSAGGLRTVGELYRELLSCSS